MARKKYTLDEVLRRLGKKHDVSINANQKHLKILKSDSVHAINDLGNKSWGKIDFLVNHNGWTRELTNKF